MQTIFQPLTRTLFDTISERVLATRPAARGPPMCGRLFRRLDGRRHKLRRSLKILVLDNDFLDEAQKFHILSLFCDAQRVYNGFARLAYRFRLKRAKLGGADVDLQLVNKLSSFPPAQKALVFQDGAVFNFRLTDLLRLWRAALDMAHTVTPSPSHPRNPYTGRDFKQAHLYNIYFAIKRSPFAVPPQIETLFRFEMDLGRFTRVLWPVLRDRAVARYVREGDLDTLFFEVSHMVCFFEKDHGQTVDGRLQRPRKEKLVNDLRDCLRIWLQGRRGVGAPSRAPRPRVRKILTDYFKTNPYAGRRVVRLPSRQFWRFRFSTPIAYEV